MSTTFSLPVVSTASLESYIHAVNSIPMLTEQREMQLARDLRDILEMDGHRFGVRHDVPRRVL